MKPIPPEKLDELADLYEHIFLSEVLSPEVKASQLRFDNECERLLQEAPTDVQRQCHSDLEIFQGIFVIPDILNHLQGGSKSRRH